MKTFPEITYFVESREQAQMAIRNRECPSRGEFLRHNLENQDVTQALLDTKGRLAVALNFSELKADVALRHLLRQWNGAGIPVDMWANLPDEHGYWIYSGNISEARRHILEMINEAERSGIRFSNIGLDLELPGQLLLGEGSPLQKYFTMKPWQCDPKHARDQLQAFIEEILGDARFGVNSYEIPMLSDSFLSRRLFAIPQPPEIDSDRYERVAMVYSSVAPPFPSVETFIQKYSHGKGRTPALGIVSANTENPGRDITFDKLLSDAELERDVRAALAVSPEKFFMFALNGLPVIERVREAIRKVS